MSIKLAILKTLGATAMVGLGAHLAQKQGGGSGLGSTKRRKKTCTPCEAMAMVDRAKSSARSGRL